MVLQLKLIVYKIIFLHNRRAHKSQDELGPGASCTDFVLLLRVFTDQKCIKARMHGMNLVDYDMFGYIIRRVPTLRPGGDIAAMRRWCSASEFGARRKH